MIELDGSQGEGGGQILRTALTLSMVTQTPFHIANIRAKRTKPGLLRQHLTAVQAATTICDAKVTGAHPGSLSLTFVPGTIKAGEYEFSIGTAGSCTLIMQTVLPALWQANGDSRVSLKGGTHNPMAPPFHFLERAFLPIVESMGAQVRSELTRYGFYPAGGGEIALQVAPCRKLAPLSLTSRGQRVDAFAESLVAGVPAHVAQRELQAIGESLNWPEEKLHIRQLASGMGPGNVLMATIRHEHVTEVFCGFGEKGVSAESVAKGVIAQIKGYLKQAAPAGEFLTDQLLLPMALAGKGDLLATTMSSHTKTNMEVIEKFLPVTFEINKHSDGWLITLRN